MEKNSYRQCTRCILDTNDDPDISFTAGGVCNYCIAYDKLKATLLKEGPEADKILKETIQKIKDYAKDRKYDCLIGLSGGVDSSYVAYLAHQFGLRALCVHFDNSWNSELAVMNIQNIVSDIDMIQLVEGPVIRQNSLGHNIVASENVFDIILFGDLVHRAIDRMISDRLDIDH